MRITHVPLALLLFVVFALAQEPAGARTLDVLYVSDGTSADRAKAFTEFLGARFASVITCDHEGVSDARFEAADIVILDWSQKRGDMPPESSPLGARGNWNRPTVFLGSAGLHHSCAWEVAGGSG